MGVRLSDLTKNRISQLSIFASEKTYIEQDDSIQKTIDDINKKYGSASIIPASIKIIGKSNKHKKTKEGEKESN